ncbi:hypothetical protein WJX72_002841 [[Myrmecia] bisecta]|uniref:Bud22 domain-containing protein n=1 Tax=[Myrmecia] bisecta TaxID=41462 RepID=A0AAW1QEK7_9CHLO
MVKQQKSRRPPSHQKGLSQTKAGRSKRRGLKPEVSDRQRLKLLHKVIKKAKQFEVGKVTRRLKALREEPGNGTELDSSKAAAQAVTLAKLQRQLEILKAFDMDALTQHAAVQSGVLAEPPASSSQPSFSPDPNAGSDTLESTRNLVAARLLAARCVREQIDSFHAAAKQRAEQAAKAAAREATDEAMAAVSAAPTACEDAHAAAAAGAEAGNRNALSGAKRAVCEDQGGATDGPAAMAAPAKRQKVSADDGQPDNGQHQQGVALELDETGQPPLGPASAASGSSDQSASGVSESEPESAVPQPSDSSDSEAPDGASAGLGATSGGQQTRKLGKPRPKRPQRKQGQQLPAPPPLEGAPPADGKKAKKQKPPKKKNRLGQRARRQLAMQAGVPPAQTPGGFKPANTNAHRSLNAPLRPYHTAKTVPGLAPGGKSYAPSGAQHRPAYGPSAGRQQAQQGGSHSAAGGKQGLKPANGKPSVPLRGGQDSKCKPVAQAPKEALHPSWEAKKKQAAVMAKPQGTKIVFDD